MNKRTFSDLNYDTSDSSLWKFYRSKRKRWVVKDTLLLYTSTRYFNAVKRHVLKITLRISQPPVLPHNILYGIGLCKKMELHHHESGIDI